MTATELEPYADGQLGQYQAGIIMTPEAAKALDDQVRACTKAVLREGTDYGHIPGTNGDEKSLWRPGAQKLLQWFGLGCICDRVDIDTDDDGHRQGVTYRATVTKRLPDGSREILATCEGYAGYDESKFYKTAEEVQRKAEEDERFFAHKDKRPARPTRWQGLPEYRAPWNTVIKRAQKRAIVGATVDATAAGGVFSTDREEDDNSPAPQDDGPSWYEQALEAALTFTGTDDGRRLYVEAAQAARDGLCTPRQATHIQNRLKQRDRLLKTAGAPVDVEDLARQAAQQHAAPERPAGAVPDETPASGPAAPAGPGDGAPEDQPGLASAVQLTKLHTILTGLGFGGREDREQKLTIAEVITGRELTGPKDGRSSANLSYTEAEKLIKKLDEFVNENGERDRDALIAYMAGREQDGDSDA